MGRVHAVSCMVGGPAWSAAAHAALRRLDPAAVDVGLHLDLTAWPQRRGGRRPLPWLVLVALLRGLDAKAVRAEISAQLDVFEHALGQAPAFVDGHQHVHQLPTVREALLDELERRYGRARPWVRSTRVPGAVHGAKPRVIERLGGAALDALATRRGFAQNRHLLGVYDFGGGAERYARELRTWLHAACDGDLLMCHPSGRDRGADGLYESRRAEFAVLGDDLFRTWLDDAAIGLAPMSRLLAAPAAAA